MGEVAKERAKPSAGRWLWGFGERGARWRRNGGGVLGAAGHVRMGSGT